MRTSTWLIPTVDCPRRVSILVLIPGTTVLNSGTGHYRRHYMNAQIKAQIDAMKSVAQQRPSGRRELILETARTLMITQGVQAVTVRGVARAANISPGNLGYHFPSYDKLLHSLMEWVIQPYLRTFAYLRASAVDDPLVSLEAVLSYVLDDLASEDTTMFFPELWVLANRHAGAAACMRELYDAYIAVLQDIISAARADLTAAQCHELALFICTSIEGQTAFVGYTRPFSQHRQALKSITLQTMIAAVVDYDGESLTTT